MIYERSSSLVFAIFLRRSYNEPHANPGYSIIVFSFQAQVTSTLITLIQQITLNFHFLVWKKNEKPEVLRIFKIIQKYFRKPGARNNRHKMSIISFQIVWPLFSIHPQKLWISHSPNYWTEKENVLIIEFENLKLKVRIFKSTNCAELSFGWIALIEQFNWEKTFLFLTFENLKGKVLKVEVRIFKSINCSSANCWFKYSNFNYQG